MRTILMVAAALAVAGCDVGYVTDNGDWRVEVIDGDTFKSHGQTWRLARIDAPEFEGHCRAGRKCVEGNPYLAKLALEDLTHMQRVTCKLVTTDVYGRNIGECFVNGHNISDRLLRLGAVQEYRR